MPPTKQRKLHNYYHRRGCRACISTTPPPPPVYISQSYFCSERNYRLVIIGNTLMVTSAHHAPPSWNVQLTATQGLRKKLTGMLLTPWYW